MLRRKRMILAQMGRKIKKKKSNGQISGPRIANAQIYRREYLDDYNRIEMA